MAEAVAQRDTARRTQARRTQARREQALRAPAHRTPARRAWAPVAPLLLLTLVSCVLLGAAIMQFLSAPSNVIELSATPASAASAPAAAQAATAQDATQPDASGDTQVPAGEGALYAGDNDGEWNSRTVDLTHEAYTSPDGAQTTVQSADGDHVIAPGTEGTYDFEVKNVGDVPLDYELTLTSEFNVRGDYVPVVIRLSSDGEWLVGGADEWVSPQALLEYEEGGDLAPGEGYGYTFEWLWPFEEADHAALNVSNLQDVPAATATASPDDNPALTATDARDTQTGNEFSADDLTLDLTINARATYDEDALKSITAPHEQGPTPKTGDDTPAAAAATIALAAGALVIAGTTLRRRERA